MTNQSQVLSGYLSLSHIDTGSHKTFCKTIIASPKRIPIPKMNPQMCASLM